MTFLGISLVIAIVIAMFSLAPWLLMLLLGALGHSFHQPGLCISFWQSVLIVFILSLVGSFFRG